LAVCHGVRVPVEQMPGPAGTSASDVVACFEAVPAIVWAFEGPQMVVVARMRERGRRPETVRELWGVRFGRYCPNWRASRSLR
jgi:hypothetical protein